ncbi:DUF2065 domain-containing protein [Hoeflea prorocentri]|uniref:DUF2065 domain-containing protein n=1 Tax=Hoeflea prorocentri TaxID=1922333 RepID=A0A9X3UFU2_9HYPH|nr:DUF2065 domain-containing protein [Hoeflea prorocentri]MCY6379972.1 DUF2065 domain-containing protein [Hoeflea prorocentri]MDA5397772.1 DUF2065 domain-containing protein [Hoeflea prorocentri]
MSDLLVAIGLFFVIEGLVYALAPSFIRRMAEELPLITDQQMRAFGLAAVGLGVFFVWMVRG